ncbi:MAG: isoprenylcysteine carboxylmethyltransferase family protein [Chthoniobacter sp.]|nr:isoprenylcysteine carboxylmethyltransferase family protein [Chthoniobacter sp.]
MNALSKKTLGSLAKFHLILAVLLFVPAGSLRFWQGWLYWVLGSGAVLVTTLYFLKHDPQLIERRMLVGPGAEPRRSQKIIQAFASIFSVALVIVPALDYRWRWSSVPVPVPVVLAADILVLLGYGVIFLVFLANTYTAGIVRVEENQKVISTGPYAVVRHPMYAGAMLQFLVTPLALGSWWGLVAVVPLCAVIIIRLLDEERHLAAELPGYSEYRAKVPHRLIPFVW